MTYFINLTSRVINKLHIIEIIKKPNKYFILMSIKGFDGWNIFSSGFISSNDNNIIEICETNNQLDYKTITEWINKVD
jgi:hypothetical protein